MGRVMDELTAARRQELEHSDRIKGLVHGPDYKPGQPDIPAELAKRREEDLALKKKLQHQKYYHQRKAKQ